MTNKKKCLSYIARKMYVDGLSDEQLTMDILESSIGGVCSKGTKLEDTRDHIDFWWTTPKGIKVSIDAKGLHRNKRHDTGFSDNHWVEVRNVLGNDGWIYGKADYISFMAEDMIMFVRPSKLIAIYEEKVMGKEVVGKIPDETYIPYQRNGRNDVIFKMPNQHLKEISSFIVKLS